jgi:putative DNA primase/helicase
LLHTKNADARSASPHIAKLKGKRAAFVSEIKPNAQFDAETLKTFSGRDTITSRRLFQDEETWLPQFSVILIGNNRPKLPEDDDAVWARMREIPFGVSFVNNPDPSIRKTLHAPSESGTAILKWMYDGLQLYQAEGLEVPPEVAEATRTNRAEMDPLRAWFEDRNQFSGTDSPTRHDYEDWCKDEGAHAVGRIRFRNALKKQGFEWKNQEWKRQIQG